MRPLAKTFAVVAVLLVLVFAATASAAYVHTVTFATGSGTGDGALSGPGRAAVEQTTGNLFVVDSGNNRVQVFKPNGSGGADYLTQFGGGELSAPWGIAIDENAGQTYVYVADAGNNRIVKYDSDEAATPSFSVNGAFSLTAGKVANFKAALAIDPTTHDLLVADRGNSLIERFESDGTFDSSFDGSAGTGSPGAFGGGAAGNGPIDVAVNSSGDVYVIDANGPDIGKQEGTSRALRYSAAGEYKATLGSVGTHERPAAVAINPRNDEVIVSGDQDSVYEAGPPPFVPALQAFDAADNPLSTPVFDPGAVNDAVTGLAIYAASADHLYAVLDSGNYFGTLYGTPQIQALVQLLPEAPAILAQSATPTQREATLRATVDPGNDATTYHFEYGATGAYGQSTPAKVIPADADPVSVQAQIEGLVPGATYHFRVVIANSIDGSEGADQTFTALAEAGADTCSNAAIRGQQDSTFLGACRAFEMVSPPFKASQDIVRTSSRTRASITGDRVTFGSGGAFADVAGVPAVATYMAERGPSGWSTRGLTPAQKTNVGSNNIDSDFFEFSPDLSKSVLRTAEPRPVADAPATVINLYTRDNDLDEFSTVTTVAPPGADQFSPNLLPEFAAASSDFQHVVFQSKGKFTPDAPENSNYKLYESVAGQLRLVSVLENGEPVPGDAVPGSSAWVEAGRNGNFAIDTVIGDDGRRIYFVEVPDPDAVSGTIYRRLDGSSTTEVTRSEATPPGAPSPATFYGASADATKALFTSSAAMVNGDSDDGLPKLYMFTDSANPLTDTNLTMLSVDNEPSDGSSPNVEGVVDYSADLNRIYFVASSQLVAGADTRFGKKLYLWDEGAITYITNLAATNLVGLTDLSTRHGGYASPDGLRLIFTAEVSESASSTIPATPQIYLYDAPEERLRCISCEPGGVAVGPASLDATMNGAYARDFGYMPRTVSDDGKRAFFNTAAALSPADSNGRIDVYEWRNDGTAEGTVGLVSTGKADSNSFFADASPSGDDAFFVTREPLVAADRDNNVDLYDARVDGGFPEPSPPSPECSGEACQGPGSSAPPPGLLPASTGFSGPPNPKRAATDRKKRCGKGKVRRGKRCVAKKSHKGRAANNNRGGHK